MTARTYEVSVHDAGEVSVAELRGLWQPAVVLPPSSTVAYTLAVTLSELMDA